MLTTLFQRNFALLWFGGLISLAGDWMLGIALPIYVYQLTGSALATSLMFIAETLPRVLLGSLAGVFADRWERKRLMVVTNLLLAAGLLPLLLLQSAAWVWVVYLVGFAEAAISQFFDPAENALLPLLVSEDRLVTANALNSLNNSLARLIGPALGGVCVGLFGVRGVVLIDLATFLIAGGMIALITVTSRPAAAAAAVPIPAWQSVWRDWLAGLRLIWRDRVIATLIGSTTVVAVGEGIFGVMILIFVRQILHGGALELGWLMSAQAIGGLLGGLVIGWVGPRFRPVILLGICALLFGVGDLLIFNVPVLIPSVVLTIVLFILVGVPGVGFSTSLSTLFQTNVADEYRGRVFGAFGTSFSLLGLLGMSLAGALGDVTGPVPLLNIQGAGYILAGLVALLVLRPVLHARRAAAPPAAETPPAVPTTG